MGGVDELDLMGKLTVCQAAYLTRLLFVRASPTAAPLSTSPIRKSDTLETQDRGQEEGRRRGGRFSVRGKLIRGT